VKVALFEPFMTGSHAEWARGYARHSRHQVKIYALEGKYWKWRMHGGALTLAHLCRSVPAQHLTSIREQVGRYSWEKMAPRYDEFFSRLKNVRR
jgi:hypothetical protein